MARGKFNNTSTGIILLAAGASSRLGSPKQLLEYHGKTLLQHSLDVAIDSGNQPVVVVLGSGAADIKKKLDARTANIVVNMKWQEGMASSLRFGVQSLLTIDPSMEALILMVCDQPFVSTSLLENLVRAHTETGKPIVSCSYGNTFGPPALFNNSLFDELLQLKGDTGARSVIKKHVAEVEVVSFPEGNLDIDTDNDYHLMQQKENVS